MKAKANIKKFKKWIDKRFKKKVHRSFRLTRKRDYQKPIKLSGNIRFTKKVWKILWKNNKLFGSLALFYALATLFIVGIASQDTYNTFKDVLDQTSGDLLAGVLGEVGKAGLMLTTAITGGLSSELSEAQQIYTSILVLITWLTTVWLLRNVMARQKVKLRDGLYNSGSPILPTFLVSLLALVQLLPLALAIIGYTAASSTGLLAGGVEAMLFWIVAFFLALMSLYWLTGTLFALIVVTLPGMYPMKAIKSANSLVYGRRLVIMSKTFWGLFVTALVWALIMIPIIMLESWLKTVWPFVSSVPIIPILLLIMSSITIVWLSSYIYILYREVVDSDNESN